MCIFILLQGNPATKKKLGKPTLLHIHAHDRGASRGQLFSPLSLSGSSSVARQTGIVEHSSGKRALEWQSSAQVALVCASCLRNNKKFQLSLFLGFLQPRFIEGIHHVVLCTRVTYEIGDIFLLLLTAVVILLITTTINFFLKGSSSNVNKDGKWREQAHVGFLSLVFFCCIVCGAECNNSLKSFL